MLKKIKIGILLLVVYLLVYGVGYKSGVAFMRMKHGVRAETIQIMAQPVQPTSYFIVETVETDYGDRTTFLEVNENDVLIRILNNPLMKHLLKMRRLEIYKSDTGERLY